MQPFSIFSGRRTCPRISWDTWHFRGLYHPLLLTVHCSWASAIWFVTTLICKDAGRLLRGPPLYQRWQHTPRQCILLILRRSTYCYLLCFIHMIPLCYPSASRACSARADSSPPEFQALWSQTTRLRYTSHKSLGYLAMHVLDTNNGTWTSQKTRQLVRKHSYEAEESEIKKQRRTSRKNILKGNKKKK